MPLKFQLRKKRDKGEKGSGEGKVAGSASTSSVGMSVDSVDDDSPVGYVVANPKKDLPTKLHQAAWNEDLEKVKKILAERKSKGKSVDPSAVDSQGRTPMHLAAARGHKVILEWLLDNDGIASAKKQDSSGNTPLMKAIECGHHNCIPLLAKMQKTMDLTNNQGYTALHLVAIKGDIESANCILDEGAYIDYKDKAGNTPLALAVVNGEREMVQFLIKEEADVNTKNYHHQTPIMLAAMHDQVSCGKLLLEDERTEVSGMDVEGMTTRDYASKHSYLILQAINKSNEDAIASGKWVPPKPDPQGLFGRKICMERGLPVPDLPLFSSDGASGEEQENNENDGSREIPQDHSFASSSEEDEEEPKKVNLRRALEGKISKSLVRDEDERSQQEEATATPYKGHVLLKLAAAAQYQKAFPSQLPSTILPPTTAAVASSSPSRDPSSKDERDGSPTSSIHDQPSTIPDKQRDVSIVEKKEKDDDIGAAVNDKEVPRLSTVEAEEGTSPSIITGSSPHLPTTRVPTDSHKSTSKDDEEKFDSESYHSESKKSGEISPTSKSRDEDFDSESYHSSAPKERGTTEGSAFQPPSSTGEVATPARAVGMARDKGSDKQDDEDDFSDFSDEDLPLGDYIPSQMSVTSHDTLSCTLTRTLTPPSSRLPAPAQVPKGLGPSISNPLQKGDVKKMQDELSDWDSENELSDDRPKILQGSQEPAVTTDGEHGEGQLTVPPVRSTQFYGGATEVGSITPSSIFLSRTMPLTATTSAIQHTLSGITSFTRSSLVSISAFPDMSESNSELEVSVNGFQPPSTVPARTSFSTSSFSAAREFLQQGGLVHLAKSDTVDRRMSEQEFPGTKLLEKDLPRLAGTVSSSPTFIVKDKDSVKALPKPEQLVQESKILAKSSSNNPSKSSSNSNPSIQELVAKHKRSSHTVVSDKFCQMEEEASKRRHAQESELQQMLQSRRKVVDGDSPSPEPTVSAPAIELPPISPQRSQVQLMMSKWEQGFDSKTEEKSGPSLPLAPMESEHSQVQLMKAKWEPSTLEEALPTVIVSPVVSEHSQALKTKSQLDQGHASDAGIPISHSEPFAISTVATSVPTLTTATKIVEAISTPQPTAQLLPTDEMERKVLRESLARESRKILSKRPSLLSDDSEGASLSSSSEVLSLEKTYSGTSQTRGIRKRSASVEIQTTTAARSTAAFPSRAEIIQGQLLEQLSDLQQKYSGAFEAKLTLENCKLDQDLKLRDLQYQLEHKKEELQATESVIRQLKGQLTRLEERLTTEVELRQSAELSYKEVEAELRQLTATNQMLQEEATQLSKQMMAEREQSSLNSSTLQEQVQIYENLKEEASRAVEQSTKFSSLLEAAEATKKKMEERVADTLKRNAQLELELKQERSEAELQQQQLEAELEELRDQLAKHESHEAVLTTMFNDTKSKIERLQSELETERSQKKSLEEQVASFSSQLSNTNLQVQQLQAEGAQHDRDLLLTNEQLKRENIVLQKDLSIAKDEQKRTGDELISTRQALSTTQQELHTTQSLATEKGIQLDRILRQQEHMQSQHSATQEYLQAERDRLNKLESQLLATTERLSGIQVELEQKKELLSRAAQREKELTAMLSDAETKYTDTNKAMIAKIEQCESALREKQEQVAQLKEERASSLRMAEAGKAKLAEDHQTLQSSHADLKSKLDIAEAAYEVVICDRDESRDLVEKLSAETTAQAQEIKELQNVIQKFNAAMESAQAQMTQAGEENHRLGNVISEQKIQLSEMKKQLEIFRQEIETRKVREEGLKSEVDKVTQSRQALQDLATHLRSEMCKLELEYEKEKSGRNKAEQECLELKDLWESEVRSRHKVTAELMKVEKLNKESGNLVDNEKRKLRKAMQKKGMAEMRLESIHAKNAQLERENGELQATLRAQEDMNSSSKVLRLTWNAEVSSLKKQLDTYQERLRANEELRLSLELQSNQMRSEFDQKLMHLEDLSREKDQEIKKLQKMNEILQADLKRTQEEVEKEKLAVSEMHIHSRRLDEQRRQEHEQRVEEMASTLRRKNQIEIERERELHMKESQNLKTMLSRVLDDYKAINESNHSYSSELDRLREKYEVEKRKRQRMSETLQRARERALRQAKLSEQRQLRFDLTLDETYSPDAHSTPAPKAPSSRPARSLEHSVMTPLSVRDLTTPAMSALDTIRRQYRL